MNDTLLIVRQYIISHTLPPSLQATTLPSWGETPRKQAATQFLTTWQRNQISTISTPSNIFLHFFWLRIDIWDVSTRMLELRHPAWGIAANEHPMTLNGRIKKFNRFIPILLPGLGVKHVEFHWMLACVPSTPQQFIHQASQDTGVRTMIFVCMHFLLFAYLVYSFCAQPSMNWAKPVFTCKKDSMDHSWTTGGSRSKIRQYWIDMDWKLEPCLAPHSR